MSKEELDEIHALRAADPVLAGTAKRIEEFPNHPNVKGKKWVLSTQLTAPDLRQYHHKLDSKAAANTKKNNTRISKSAPSLVKR